MFDVLISDVALGENDTAGLNVTVWQGRRGRDGKMSHRDKTSQHGRRGGVTQAGNMSQMGRFVTVQVKTVDVMSL